MNGLSAGTFQQVVDAGDDEQLVTVFLQMQQAFVGIDYLFEVDVLVHDVYERVFCIVLLVHADNLVQGNFRFNNDGGEDAARKISPVRDEVDLGIKAVLQLLQRLLDFGHKIGRASCRERV